MRYFAYIAEQAFKTSPTGERLFYRGGPWSRPYIVPDSNTERRLFRKQLWMLRVLLGGLIVGQAFLFTLVPAVVQDPTWFLSYGAAVLAVTWVVGFVIFRPDLRRLGRASARLPVRGFYADMARRHNVDTLRAGLTGSILFVAGGVLMLLTGHNPVVAVVCTAFFAACGLGWWYALQLKRELSAQSAGTGGLPEAEPGAAADGGAGRLSQDCRSLGPRRG